MLMNPNISVSKLLKFTSMGSEQLREYWLSLQNDNPSCSIFQTYYWLNEWEKAYGGDHNVEVWVEVIKDQPIALVPLMTLKNNVRFLSCNCSDYAGLITPNEVQNIPELLLDEIVRLGRKRNWLFWNMPLDGAGTRLLIEKLKEKNISYHRKNNKIFNIDLEHMGLEQYWQSISSNLRRNFRRNQRRLGYLNAQFAVNYQISRKTLDQMAMLHIKRWKEKGKKSKYTDVRRRQFVYSLPLMRDSFRKIVAFTLHIENRLIAYRFGFIDGKIYRDWNTSFDTTYSQFSPGSVLMGYIVDYLINQQIHRFDFLRGEEEYKSFWANTSSIITTVSHKADEND